MKLAKAYTVLMGLLRKYPAMSAALLNIGVMVAGSFGLHATGEHLLAVVGVVAALSGAIVHSNIVPAAKLEDLARSGYGDTSGKRDTSNHRRSR